MQSTKQMRSALYENVVVTIKLSYVLFNLSKFIFKVRGKERNGKNLAIKGWGIERKKIRRGKISL